MAAAGPAALAMQAIGGLIGGIENNRAARAGAKVDEENARLSILEGEQQADATRTQERLQAGEMIAGMAGSGIQLGTGTAGDLLAESAYQRELEVLNIRTRAGRESDNLMQAASDKRKAGRAALIGGIFGATATALQGASDLRAQRLSRASSQTVWDEQTRRVPRPSIVGVTR